MRNTPVPMLADMPDLMTLKEVARIFRCGVNTPYDMVHEGKLKAIKVGNKYLVPKAVIAQLMEVP